MGGGEGERKESKNSILSFLTEVCLFPLFDLSYISRMFSKTYITSGSFASLLAKRGQGHLSFERLKKQHLFIVLIEMYILISKDKFLVFKGGRGK